MVKSSGAILRRVNQSYHEWRFSYLLVFFAFSSLVLNLMAEEEHEDFSNTANAGASLTYPMQVF
jgi:hypothetical protein